MGLIDFAGYVSNRIEALNEQKKDFDELSDFPLIAGKQSIYVMDWSKDKITYCRGILDFLGYTEEEFNMSMALKRIHPDDEKVVSRVIKGIVNHCIQENVSGKNEYLNITYRIRKRDGSYVKVLRTSGAYEVNLKGELVSNWSVLTDINFISNENQVEWDFNASALDVEGLREEVFKEFKNFFTLTELLVIHAIHKGFKNREIAENLNISVHTVATHRKNIMRKSNCSNVKQLMSFCFRNGILKNSV